MKQSLFILLIMSLFSCSKYKEKISEKTILSEFREISLESSFNVFLKEGNEYSIEIECSKKYLDKITFSVKDSVLIVKNIANGIWLHPKSNKVQLTITSPNLRLLTAIESCHIKTLNPITTSEFGLIVKSKLNMAEIEVNNQTTYCWNNRPCGGTLTFKGNTTTFKAWPTAILTIDAKNLNAQNAYIVNNGKNDVLISPTNYLNYSILGKGNIQLFQHPLQIDSVSNSGEGTLIFH